MPDELDNVPEQVKAAREAAWKAFEKTENEPGGEDAEEPEPVTPETATAEKGATALLTTVVEPAKTEGEPPPAPVTPPQEPVLPLLVEPPVTPDIQEELRKLKQAHIVLTGKFTKEVPRLHRELRERGERIKDLEDRLAHPPAAPVVAPEGVSAENPYGLTDDELEARDWVGGAAKIAKVEARKIAAEEAAKTLKTIENERKRSADATRAGEFFSTLEAAVPDWKEVNGDPDQANSDGDPAFHAWLTKIDPVEGVLRQRRLFKAQNEGDVATVIELFDEYKQTKALGARPKTPAAPPRPSVASQVAANITAVRESAPAKTTYTLAQYKDAKSKIMEAQRGNNQMTKAEVKALSAEIDEALAEGRVVA